MSEETKYLYYRIDFIDCGNVEYDYTICETLDEIMDNITMVDTDLDDDTRNAEVKIKGIGMTKKEYSEFVKGCDSY